MSLLPTLVTAGTVTDLQSQLYASAKGTDDSIRACSALDTPTRSAWGLFYIQCVDFATKSPGFFTAGADMNQGQSLARELYQWQVQLSSSCHLGVPLFNPEPPGNDQWTTIARYAMIAAVAVAGAYAVGRLVEVIPKPLARG